MSESIDQHRNGLEGLEPTVAILSFLQMVDPDNGTHLLRPRFILRGDVAPEVETHVRQRTDSARFFGARYLHSDLSILSVPTCPTCGKRNVSLYWYMPAELHLAKGEIEGLLLNESALPVRPVTRCNTSTWDAAGIVGCPGWEDVPSAEDLEELGAVARAFLLGLVEYREPQTTQWVSKVHREIYGSGRDWGQQLTGRVLDDCFS